MVTKLFCCTCDDMVFVRLTNGKEIYPHSSKLFELPFYKCDKCKNYVGCHHKTKDRTRPLGCIPSKEIKVARQYIHKIVDPLWQKHPQKYRARGWIYRWLSSQLGYQYHTAEIKSIKEARKIYALVLTIQNAEDCK